MRVSFGRFLFFSLVIHGIIFAAFSFFKKPTLKKENISVEYKTDKPGPSTDSIPKPSTKKIAKNNLRPARSATESVTLSPLDKFKPTLNFSASANAARTSEQGLLGNNGDTFDVSPNKDNHNASWGSGSASFGRIQDYLLYKKIYDYVDGALFFPSFFVRRNIQGVTNARLVLNSDGNCDWEKTKIYGNDAFMQIYVLSVLKTACKQTFKPFIKDRIVTNVDLSFQFAITEPTTTKEQADENKFIVGNTLMFYRNSYKSVMQWEFGPFQGIFPVPAVYLNLPWIQENWDKIMNHKDPISEFKKEFGS